MINVSVQAGDQPDLREAVAYALAKDVVVVAAAGNVQKEGRRIPVAAYPAAYEGVLSVGSAGPDGREGRLLQRRHPRRRPGTRPGT